MKNSKKQKNIPKGWKEDSLGKICTYIVDNRGKTPPVSEEGIPLIEVNAMSQKSINYTKINKFITQETFDTWFRKYLKDGDTLFSTVGRTAMTSLYSDSVKAGIAQNIVGLRFESQNPVYMYYMLSQKRNNHKFKSIEMIAVQPSVKVSQMVNLKFIFPPLPEQNRIVSVLETWDAGIEKLKQKIAVKNEIKKGLMQELLTGKKRLPGFSEEWKSKKLEQIAICLDTQRIPLNSSDRSGMSGNIPYCGANNIMDYINDYIFDEDVILVAEDGGQFDEYQNRPIAYRVSGKSWVNNHAHVIKANEHNSQDFLFYSTVHKNVLMYINGGTRAKLNKSALLSMKYEVPAIKEQKAIASILTASDKEINVLNKKLTYWQGQKKYLLNNLVTGQLRTPENLLETTNHK